MLGNMFSEQHSILKQSDGSIFIDPDGTYFRIILSYLRRTIASPDDKLLPFNLLAEVNYYQLQRLKEIFKPDRKKFCNLLLKTKYSNLLKQPIRSVRRLSISHLKNIH